MARKGSNIIPFDDAWRRSSARSRSSYRDSYRTDESSRRARRQSFGRDFDDSRLERQEPVSRPSREAFHMVDGEFPAEPAWPSRSDEGVRTRPAGEGRTASPRLGDVSRSARPGDSLVAGFGERRSVRQAAQEEGPQDQAPRAAVEVYDKDSFDDEEDSPRGKSRADRKKKQKLKAKAEKLFMRQFGGSDKSDGAEGGSRAALYKGEMGRSHKRAFENLGGSTKGRRSSEGKARSSSKAASEGGVSKLIILGIVLTALLFAAVFLYPPARQYYLEMRTNAQLQAEYEALTERNEAIQEEIDHLSTDEGVQDEAREQLGWVQEGEVAVVVEGLEAEEEEKPVRAQVASGSVPAPTTWYSPVLDVIFGFNDGTGVDTSRQEAAANVDDAGVKESKEAEEAEGESADQE